MTSFEITEEYRALEELLNEVDEETGEFLNNEEDIKEYIEKLGQDKNKKLNNIQDLKLSNVGAIESLDVKIKKLQARKKSIDTLNKKLSDIQEMLLMGTKVKTDEYTFSYRKSKSVEIDSMIFSIDKDNEYCNATYKVDKTAIKKAIESGAEVLGAEIVSKTSLSVR